MLDKTKFEHVQLELPNLYCAYDIHHKDMYEGYAFEVATSLKPFILEAATKFPAWTFVGVRAYADDRLKTVYFRTVKVFQNREELGAILYTMNRNNDVVIWLENDRIEKKRERGSGMKTKDTKKALRAMQTFFGSKTIYERLIDASDECASSMYYTQSHARNDFVRGYDDLTLHLKDYIFENLEKYKGIALHRGASPQAIDQLMNDFENYNVMESVWEPAQKQSGVFVIPHGNDYAVLTPARGTNTEATMQILREDDVSDWMRLGLGMLKLVEPKQFVRDIGYKINDGSFFLLDKDETV